MQASPRAWRNLLALAIFSAWLAGCDVPLSPELGDALASGRTQRDGGPAQIRRVGEATSLLVQPKSRFGGLMVLTNPRPKSARVALSLTKRAAGYRLASGPEQAPLPPGSDSRWRSSAEATSVQPPPFHTPFRERLRDWERGWLRAVPAQTRQYALREVARPRVGESETFWVISEVSGGRALEGQVQARAVFVGEHVVVYLDQELDSVRRSAAWVQMGEDFERDIYPTTVRLFGAPVAGGSLKGSRVSLLVSPAVGNYGQETTIGYFTARDLFAAQAGSNTARSNQRLMLYMSPFVVAAGRRADYMGTIAHEFQHLINASRKLFGDTPTSRGETEEVWLDEMLSMYAMAANGYGIDSGDSSILLAHVMAFLRDPGSYSLTDWDLNPEQSAYGAAYLFAAYAVEQLGEEFLRELVDSPLLGAANLNKVLEARGTRFEAMMQDWALATALDETGFSGEARHAYRALRLIGRYGARSLRGVRMDRASAAPSRSAWTMKPNSVRYVLVGDMATSPFELFYDANDVGDAVLVLP
ncbi:MAG: hypothetical protein VKP62_08325 [Candidatus Sericytochromatia bacterium]|nr:hypothetical protein [Candidatus Sericytochromatia bacterium]